MRTIYTAYAGRRFDAPLKAKWARFFDVLGVAWQGERLDDFSSSSCYRPDFWLPGVRDGIWYVVKSEPPTKEEQAAVLELAARTDKWVAVSVGGIPVGNTPFGEWRSRTFYLPPDHVPNGAIPVAGGVKWMVGRHTGRVWLGYEDEGVEDGFDPYHPDLVAALGAARSAVFENTETSETLR